MIVPLGMAISRQYLMPIGQVKEYNRSVIIGAIINLVANLILLPSIGFLGVVFSTILAESFVTVVRTRAFLKQTTFTFSLRKIGMFIIAGLIMCLITRLLTGHLTSNIRTNLIQFVIACPIYLAITTITKVNPLVDLLRIKRKSNDDKQQVKDLESGCC